MKALAVVSLSILCIDSASPTTLAFEDLRTTGTEAGFAATPYISDGFTLTSSSGELLFWNTGSPYFLGRPAVFPHELGDTVTVRRQDGGSFSLASLDLAPFAPIIALPYTVEFVGLLAGGGTIIKTVSVAASDSFSHAAFDNDLRGIAELSWSMGKGNFSQITNLVIDSSTSPVPEPSTFLMLCTGIAGAVLASGRRRRTGACTNSAPLSSTVTQLKRVS